MITKSGHMINGWIPLPPDVRDFQYFNIAKAKIIAPKSDLRPNCSVVEDQRQLGSCVYNASVGALEFLKILSEVPRSKLRGI